MRLSAEVRAEKVAELKRLVAAAETPEERRDRARAHHLDRHRVPEAARPALVKLWRQLEGA